MSERLIKRMHAIIMEGLLESPGEYRRIHVLIEKTEHEPSPAFDVPELMEELIGWYRKNNKKMHPFVDGRVARALLNFVLEKHGYPTLYLGLEYGKEYLDVVAEGNLENYKSIFDFMRKVYLQQHNTIIKEVSGKIEKREMEAFPEIRNLQGKFLRLKKS